MRLQIFIHFVKIILKVLPMDTNQSMRWSGRLLIYLHLFSGLKMVL